MTSQHPPLARAHIRSLIKAHELGLDRGFNIRVKNPKDRAQVLARSYVASAHRFDRLRRRLRAVHRSLQ